MTLRQALEDLARLAAAGAFVAALMLWLGVFGGHVAERGAREGVQAASAARQPFPRVAPGGS